MKIFLIKLLQILRECIFVKEPKVQSSYSADTHISKIIAHMVAHIGYALEIVMANAKHESLQSIKLVKLSLKIKCTIMNKSQSAKSKVWKLFHFRLCWNISKTVLNMKNNEKKSLHSLLMKCCDEKS